MEFDVFINFKNFFKYEYIKFNFFNLKYLYFKMICIKLKLFCLKYIYLYMIVKYCMVIINGFYMYILIREYRV